MLMNPVLDLPAAQSVWPELDDESAAVGFRNAEACQMAASFWPGADHQRVLEQVAPSKRTTPKHTDDARVERTFWRIERSQGVLAAISWWRARQPELPFPKGGWLEADEADRFAWVVSRRSATLQVGPGVLGVRFSTAEAPPDPCAYGCRCCAHVEDCECDVCEQDRADAEALAEMLAGQDEAPDEHVVREFSQRSKGRMMRFIASVAWGDIRFDDERLVMLTLTYPGDWRKWCPTPEQAIAHLDAFVKRFRRATGRTLRCVWVREFQRRGAPHFHLLVLWPKRIDGQHSKDWLSQAWFKVVGSEDPNHLRAGTRLDWANSLRGALDSKRVAAYFAGYVSAYSKDKGYQHEAPEAWRNKNGSVGGFWGRRSVTKATAEVAVTAGEVIEMKRLIRRMIRSQKRTITRQVDRGQPVGYVNVETGERLTTDAFQQLEASERCQWQPIKRRRRVTRRWQLRSLTPQGPAADGERGFTVFSNDAPALAIQLARAIHQTDEPWPRGQPRPLP
jgi:hypothetical protein